MFGSLKNREDKHTADGDQRLSGGPAQAARPAGIIPPFTVALALPPIAAIRSCRLMSAAEIIAGPDRDKVSDDDNALRLGCILWATM
jgi:hypothetical protein